MRSLAECSSSIHLYISRSKKDNGLYDCRFHTGRPDEQVSGESVHEGPKLPADQLGWLSTTSEATGLLSLEGRGFQAFPSSPGLPIGASKISRQPSLRYMAMETLEGRPEVLIGRSGSVKFQH